MHERIQASLPRLLLASSSPRRRQLLGGLAVPFRVVASGVDETVPEAVAPAAAVVELALRKARAVAAGPAELVLAADTTVAFEGRMLGKPEETNAARSMLRCLRGRSHVVYTGLALLGRQAAKTALVATAVATRDFTDAEIEASLAAGTPFDKAGGYGIQDGDLRPVAAIDGCYCNVMGLPLWSVYHLLLDAACEPRPAPPDVTWQRCSACPLRPRMQRP